MPAVSQSGPPSMPPVPRAGGSASWARSMKAVAWSLLGLRKGSEYAQDQHSIHPIHVIVVGLLAVFLLVVGLMVLVNMVV